MDIQDKGFPFCPENENEEKYVCSTCGGNVFELDDDGHCADCESSPQTYNILTSNIALMENAKFEDENNFVNEAIESHCKPFAELHKNPVNFAKEFFTELIKLPDNEYFKVLNFIQTQI